MTPRHRVAGPVAAAIRAVRALVDAVRVDPQSGLSWRALRQLEQRRATADYQQAIEDAIRAEERRRSRWL
ncbi:hypothetical protein [Amycolatopsis thermophila]|uniref:Uncharacterized protein n=1 Tax=Amycolatopsis thermophila TaxID=206084 RepID=A0ABU0ERK7_9PSEU|nr:hypothetical protein [Amycolatopsis thermophila]MDQ0377930.1 hypothetical protein [Amycolatopsis thermophila]